MSKETNIIFIGGCVAMAVAGWIAPLQWIWLPIVGIGILAGLWGVANAISEKKS